MLSTLTKNKSLAKPTYCLHVGIKTTISYGRCQCTTLTWNERNKICFTM